jgi:hypothetical protein
MLFVRLCAFVGSVAIYNSLMHGHGLFKIELIYSAKIRMELGKRCVHCCNLISLNSGNYFS